MNAAGRARVGMAVRAIAPEWREELNLRNHVTDVVVFVGEALLAVACFRISAGEGSMAFFTLGILAAGSAALPLWDWINREEA